MAMKFFGEKNIDEQYSFYHYYGMKCNARHGKLFEKNFYIENLLKAFYFVKEHEKTTAGKLLKC